MTEQANTVHASSYDYIKIATKLENSQSGKQFEDQLNRTIPRDIKRGPHRDWQEGQRGETGWSHAYMWWLSNRRDISAEDGLQGETGGGWKFRHTHRQIHPQALTLVSGRGTAAWEVPETYKERLSCMASGSELEGKPSLSLY